MVADTAVASAGPYIYHTLSYLHSLGIVHCHLKPEHLLYDPVSKELSIIGLGKAYQPHVDEKLHTVCTALLVWHGFSGTARIKAAACRLHGRMNFEHWCCYACPPTAFSGSTQQRRDHSTVVYQPMIVWAA